MNPLASEENESDRAPELKSPSLTLNLKQLVNVAMAQGILYSAKWLMGCFGQYGTDNECMNLKRREQ